MSFPARPIPSEPVTCRAVIFDLDDTLIDTSGLLVADGHLRAAAAMAAALAGDDEEQAAADAGDDRGGARDARGWTDVRKPIARDDLAPDAQRLYDLRVELFPTTPRGGLEQAVLAAYEHDGSRASAAIAAGVKAYHRPRIPAEGLALPGVRSMLRRLRRHFTLYLVTRGDMAIQAEKARKSGLLPSFDQARYVPLSSDKRAALQRLVEQGLPADEVVVIGDRPDAEIAAANALGMWTIRVQRGEFGDVAPASEDEVPHWTIPDPRQVQALMDNFFMPPMVRTPDGEPA